MLVDGDVMDPLERLIAVQEISDLIGRYCMLFDDEDWAGLDQLWTDDAAFVVDDVAFEGREARDGLPEPLPPSRLPHETHDLTTGGRPSAPTASPRRPAPTWCGSRRTSRTRSSAATRTTSSAASDGWRFSRRVERPVQYVPGPPPMSDTADGVSGATMRRPTACRPIVYDVTASSTNEGMVPTCPETRKPQW